METSIVPCRAEISDRFPVASFAVSAPASRLFEVACATDPRLFHTDWQRYRSPQNFYTSRTDGLMRAPGGHTAWFIPPEQLRRFAGAPRIYYVLATYENAYGGAPEFTISPEGLDRVPCIALAADFTGRGLDRSRLGGAPPVPDVYGAVSPAALSWGGDDALAAYRASYASPAAEGYDDGYPAELWQQEPVAGQAGGDDPLAGELGADCRDAEEDPATVAMGAAFEAPYEDDAVEYAEAAADFEAPYEDEPDDYARASAAEAVAELGAEGEWQAGEGGYGAPYAEAEADDDAADDDGGYGGYEDAAELRGAGALAADEEDADDGDDADSYGVVYLGAGGAVYGGTEIGAENPCRDPDGYGAHDGPGDAAYGAAEGGYGGYAADEIVQAAPEGGYGGYAEDEPAYGNADSGWSGDGGATAVADPDIAAEVEALGGRDTEYSDDEPEEEPLPVGRASEALAIVPLDIPEKVRLLRVVAVAESGHDGYAAVNPDNEYNTPGHPAYRRFHIGLSWGFIQFTQRSGALGRVLRAVRRREDEPGAAISPAQRFASLFGPNAEELLRVTNAPDEEARVANVGGKPLWDPEWTARFRAAGAVPHVTWAQNEVAVTTYADPNLRLAHWLGFDTPRALAMLWDRCIHMGNGGGAAWILRVCGPVQTDEDRRAALAALGFADLRAFQQARAPHLRADGRWGPRTHAALAAALRDLGARSPLPVPARDEMLRRMVEASRGARWHARLQRLHASTDVSDETRYALG